jgi:hypothetical protein
MLHPEAGKDLEVNTKADGIAAGGPVGAGAGDERLKDDDVPCLRALERVNGVVELNLGHLHFYTGIVSAATGKKHNIFAADGFLYGYFHFPVGETIRTEDINGVDGFGYMTELGILCHKVGDVRRVIPHRPGGGYDEIIHGSLR